MSEHSAEFILKSLICEASNIQSIYDFGKEFDTLTKVVITDNQVISYEEKNERIHVYHTPLREITGTYLQGRYDENHKANRYTLSLFTFRRDIEISIFSVDKDKIAELVAHINGLINFNE